MRDLSAIRAPEMASPRDIVTRRVAGVIDRLCVAMEFSTLDTPVLAQALHAVEIAAKGPTGRTDDDYLPGIETDEALALVRALLPFVKAARHRPGPETAMS